MLLARELAGYRLRTRVTARFGLLRFMTLVRY
jgi:hypothetical protein